MGKRELLIVIAFVVVGAAAYQVTAPPPKAGERSFSLRQIFSGVRRELSSNAHSALVGTAGNLKAPTGVTELRISTARSVPVTVVGEARADVGYEIEVESNGPDEATAKEWAGRVKILADDLGPALALSLYFPPEGTQRAKVTFRVPSEFTVRLENSGRIAVTAVAAVDLRNIAGETTLTGVAGAVTGSHRSGELTVTGAGSVDLSLTSSRARFRAVRAGVALTARNGEVTIGDSAGAIDLGMTNVETEVTGHRGSIKVGGDGGQLTIAAPAGSVSVDARRMSVDLVLGDSGPVTIITSEETLKVTLTGSPAQVIDAVTNEGEIRAGDLGVAPTTDDRQTRLLAKLGDGARVVLRNTRGDIVIARRK